MDEAAVQELRDRLVTLTRDLVLIPSVAASPEDIFRCAESIANHLDVLEEVEVHHYERNGSPSVVALPRGIQHPEVLLNAHLDVVVHPDRNVYRAQVADGRIHGPGAGDMKGQIAILLTLFHEFHRRQPGISLGLAITSDEERGGYDGMQYLFEEVGLRCGVALIPDGGSLDEVTVAEKGVLNLRLRSSGAGAHAARPWLARNPLAELTRSITRLEEHARQWRGQDGHWYPTLTPTVLRCPNETINRIPEYAEALIDIRVPPPWTPAGLLEELRMIVGEAVELETIGLADATNLSPDPAYLRAIEEEMGAPAKLMRSDGASDARYVVIHDIPVLMSRPLVGGLHTVDEWIDIESMLVFYRYCRRYLEVKLLS
jgi:succinyl-diaminopimelate desuccinylase